MRRRFFAGITVALAVGVALVLAEVSLRAIERLPKRDVLDYPDTRREGGLGPGGYLEEGFSGNVIDGYGATVRWSNNAEGFRYDRDVSSVPEPGMLPGITLGNDISQTHVALDPRGAFRLEVEDDAVRVERREGEATLGFRHGLETRLIPDEHRESKSLLRRAAVKLEHLRIVRARLAEPD